MHSLGSLLSPALSRLSQRDVSTLTLGWRHSPWSHITNSKASASTESPEYLLQGLTDALRVTDLLGASQSIQADDRDCPSLCLRRDSEVVTQMGWIWAWHCGLGWERSHRHWAETFALDPERCFQTPALTSQKESGGTGVISTQRQTQIPAAMTSSSRGNAKTQAKPGKAAIRTVVSRLCCAGAMIDRKTCTYYKVFRALSGVMIKLQVRSGEKMAEFLGSFLISIIRKPSQTP